jgi:mannose-6-phosphate isomerase-like protein (cupin superfamily)
MNDLTRQTISERFGEVPIYPDGFDAETAKYRGASGALKPIVQDKPWGAETWLVFTDKYAFKILWIEPGKKFSLQTHKLKEESWYVVSGSPRIRIGNDNIAGKSGMLVHIKPNTLHRVEAGEETAEIWEVSTPELWDVKRIEDDFGRK